MILHDKNALITAVRTATKPVAFLVGAPLSADSGGGVPGVAQMLDLARDEIRRRAPGDLHRFEDAIRGTTGGDAYQAAMTWLQGNLTQDGVNRVVKAAVLRARRADSPMVFDGDGSASDWYIPAGTQALASLMCRDRERVIGPVLTTNFDPLLSVTIEACGGRAHLRVIQSDGRLAQYVKRPGEIEVIHLHGFWRGSDTLHTPSQLTAPRPRLKDSLKEVLRQRTLVVAAYGGWDDVFASALSEVARDDAAQVQVLWCFRDADATAVSREYAQLFDHVQAAITRGRFVAYGGIDCHSIFADIASALPAWSVAIPHGIGGAPQSTIAGWQSVDAAFLRDLPPLSHGEALRFFDGAIPTWRHALSDAIPRRKPVALLCSRIAATLGAGASSSLQLIRAAGGEGKSTILLQAAADATRTAGLAVLWRSSPKEGLSPEQVARLDPLSQWLIVADDADNLVADAADSARRLHAGGRSNVHFLLAARDADWRWASGDAPPWEEWLTRHPDVLLRGIDHDDAAAVVRAWEKCGPEALRELASQVETADRVVALERAIRDAASKQAQQSRKRQVLDGSFFGGLLFVRFGQDGLRAHVRALMAELAKMPIEGGNGSLSDALLYVATCHGVGIPGIDERVLGDLLGVPRDWVHRRIVRPMGEEATAVHSHGHVLTRHSRVATAVLVEAERAFGIDLAELWSRLVRQTVVTSKNGGVSRETHARIVNAGTWLQKALPLQLDEARRKAIAIGAAQASVSAEPERLNRLVNLGKAYRQANEIESASRVFRDTWTTAAAKVDYQSSIRGFCYEWGVCEGRAGDAGIHRGADAWLQGLALSDELNPATITDENCKLICAGLGVAFGKLATVAPDCSYAKARRAAACLGRLTHPDAQAKRYFAKHDRAADKLKTPYARDVAEAIDWLAAGVNRAGGELRDDFLAGLAPRTGVTFTLLRSVIEPRQQR